MNARPGGDREGCRVPGASPPFAGNEANVIGLTVRVDSPRLPPLLITSVNYVKHIPKVEAQGLAQEAAVLGLVVIEQGPVAQVTMGQGLAEDSRKDAQLPREPASLGQSLRQSMNC